MPALSVIVPTFNESANVRMLAARVAEAMAATPYELIFVDDSIDNTPEVLDALAREDACVRYHHRENGRGLGTAVVKGIELSRAETIAVIDGDLQHPPELLPAMLAAMPEADIVIPTRFVEGGDDGGLDPFRKLVSGVARYLGKFVLRRLRGVSDPTSGYFMFRRSVVAGKELTPIGWKILLEVLVRGRYERIVEIPYSFAPRVAGESKLSSREHINYLVHLGKLAASSPADRRFYLSTAVGMTGVIVNMLVYILLLHYAVAPVLSGGVAALSALLWNFTLNDQLTWRHMAHGFEWFRAVRYVTTAAIGIALAILTLTLLVLDAHVAPVLANVVAIAVSAAWNFTAHNLWTWKPDDLDAGPGFTVKHVVAG